MFFSPEEMATAAAAAAAAPQEVEVESRWSHTNP